MKWLVGYTGINQEFLSQRNMTERQITVYCPIGRKTVRHARKEETRLFPIFSRYLFIHTLAEAEHLAAIRATNGLIDILTNNYDPLEVHFSIIDDIKQRELAGEFDIRPQYKPKRPKWSKSFEILKQLLDPTASIEVI